MSKLENDILYREIFMSNKSSGGGTGGITPTGTKTIEVTQNGTVTSDVTDFATVKVDTNVPIPDGYVKPHGAAGVYYNANGKYTEDVTKRESIDVTVDVPIPDGYVKPAGTAGVYYNANGKYTEDVTKRESIDVTVDVPIPDGYVQPEGLAILRERYVDYDVTNFATARVAIMDYAQMLIDGGITEYSNSNLQIIRNSAFYGCKSLTNVELPSAVTISQYAFSHCQEMVSAITNAKTIGAYAFSHCYVLDHLDLPNLRSVENKAFDRADSLKYVKIGTQESTTVATAKNDPSFKYGYTKIYVADSLVDAYKSATNWSTYAAQIYPLSEFTE